MNESFIATHERPWRVLLMDGIASLCVVPLALLLFSGLGQPESWLILLPATALFLIRRVAPVTFLWLATVLAGVSYATYFDFEVFIYFLVLIAVYGSAAFSPKRQRWLGFVPLALAIALMILDAVFEVLPESGSTFFLWTREAALEHRITAVVEIAIVAAIAFVAVWALGMLRRSQLMDVVRQRERADLLERDAHRLAELAVTEERTRISREMHDIIAHSLASILTLAEGGRMGTKQRGDEHSHNLFGKISGAARSALNEVKVLLKQVDAAQGDAPAYGIGDIVDLVENARLAGLPIEFDVVGTAKALPAGHSLAVYRIAQESITNILKHAPGQASEMVLCWGEERCSLVTRNALPALGTVASGASEGKGLVGMRERAEIFEGDLRVTQTGHIFEVRAEWPTASAA